MNTSTLLTTLALATLVAGACRKQADTETTPPAPDPAPAAKAKAQPAAEDDSAATEAAEAKAIADAEKRGRERAAAQVNAGEAVYDANCAKCHGQEGTGKKGKYPAVIGDAALPESPPKKARLRKDEMGSGQDLLDFISESMPPKKAGSLSEDDYLAVTAFLVSANGIELGDAVSADNAGDIDLARTDGAEDGDEDGE